MRFCVFVVFAKSKNKEQNGPKIKTTCQSCGEQTGANARGSRCAFKATPDRLTVGLDASVHPVGQNSGCAAQTALAANAVSQRVCHGAIAI